MGTARLTDDLLLNQSLKTHRTFFQASWRPPADTAHRFADTDRSVARCFALPSGATIERVLRDERAAYGQWLVWLKGLKTGDSVYVSTFGKSGQVVRMQLHKQSAIVSIGVIDHEVQLTVLSRPAE